MWVVWLVLLGSLAVGAVAGMATRKYGKHGVVILGAWLGGIIGQVLYSILFRLIWENNGTEIMWASIIVFSAIMAYMSYLYFHFSVIAGSSIIGSFLFFRVSIAHKLTSYRVCRSSQEAIPMSSCFTTACRTPLGRCQ
jgi:hypothetical protein